MIGMIITGHGEFASGLHSSMKLIVGEQKNVAAIDFLESDSTEALGKKLKIAIETLACENVVFYSDLLGGSPFKEAVEVCMKLGKGRVIAGTNLAMLLEASMMKDEVSIDVLVLMSLETGKTGISQFEMRKREEAVDSEGI